MAASPADLTKGMELLKGFLRRVDLEVDGCVVAVKYVLELPTPELAKNLAMSLKQQIEGGG